MSAHTSYWLNFFREAGLPEKIGTKYAVLFAGERVDPSMLGEISRDILKDMGITAMGDIIAILRHARIILDKNREEKTLEGMVRSTPAGRMIAHYVGSSSEKTTSPQPRKTTPDNPKSKRVVPDAGVNYKVILPKGTTPKTRAILEKMKEDKKAQGTRVNVSMKADKIQPRSVFARLASSGIQKSSPVPSATIPPTAPPSTETVSSNSKTDGSVFHRLGPRGSSTTPNIPPLMDESPSSAKYLGILKGSSGVKRRIGEPGTAVGVASSTGPSFSKRARLSTKVVVRAEATSTTHSEGIFGRASRPSSVYSRLGGAREKAALDSRVGSASSKSSQPFRVTGTAPVISGPLPPRRVTPEIEGRYKINLPRGTTPKTRAILQRLKQTRRRSANDNWKPIVWDL